MACASLNLCLLLRVAVRWFAHLEFVVPMDGSDVRDNARPRFASHSNRDFGCTAFFGIGRALVSAHHCQFPRIHTNAPLELVGLVQHATRTS